MTISTETTLNKREITSDGTIQLRFAKVVRNGTVVLSSEWHRTMLAPGDDIDAQINAVSAHLETMGYPAVSADDLATIKATAAAEWSPEVIAAYQAAKPTPEPEQ